jgi:hypothetical protein
MKWRADSEHSENSWTQSLSHTKYMKKKKFHSVIFSFGYINYIIDPTAVIINSTNYTNTDKIE